MSLYRLLWPLLSRLEPEAAHRVALLSFKSGVAGLLYRSPPDDTVLRTHVWGHTFPNPIGLAPGFDKNAEVVGHMPKIGFGFAEIGGVTPLPQPGNPRPRLFRLTEDKAIINRLGFNSQGMVEVAARLGQLRRHDRDSIIGVNLGKNKDSQDAAADYVAGVKAFAGLVNFIVINVSSPNTPGLRALQDVDSLVTLTRAVREAREQTGSNAPLLFKIAPDLDISDTADICRVALAEKMDGIVISNTTIARPESLTSSHADETGGLSGAPLFGPSTQMLREVYALTEGALPIIGVGGVSSAEQAYEKIRAGASLVQLYSAMVYEGPGLITKIKQGLAHLLRRDGFNSVTQAIGADHRKA
jgi:dihydroorotate dehydrogenase